MLVHSWRRALIGLELARTIAAIGARFIRRAGMGSITKGDFPEL
jgi:hypothetical protein